jgi:hypothetical protein
VSGKNERGHHVTFDLSDLADLFDRRVERVLNVEGADFVRELRFLLVEDWLKNSRVRPFVKEMVTARKRRREEYLYSLNQHHREPSQPSHPSTIKRHASSRRIVS